MDLGIINEVKRIALVALVSDDILMEKLVLKGGNAINLIYALSSRASLDLDLSMKDDFSEEEFEDIENRIKDTLIKTFNEHGYTLIDLKFYDKPEAVDERVRHFWGGYAIEFKIIESEKAKRFTKIDDLRRNAIPVGKNNSTKYLIDISKYEFVDKKADYEIDGLTLYAYTPEMIICEKIRALCQQVPEYKSIVKSITPKSRARDFYDIYLLMEHFKIDLVTDENVQLLENIMLAKKVPIDYLSKIKDSRQLHESSFAAVEDTLESDEEIEDFNFYFEFLTDLCDKMSAKMRE